MRQHSRLAAACTAVLTALLLPQSAWANNNCHTIRGVYQSQYDANAGGWLGELSVLLDDKELLIGKIVAATPGVTIRAGAAGYDKGGYLTWAFGSGADTFRTGDQHGMFIISVEGTGVGQYSGSARIVAGSGRFVNAAGSYTWSGRYLLWRSDPNDPNSALQGRWNADFNGTVCNVLPASQ